MAGALIGALLATTGLLKPSSIENDNAAAIVNGAIISKSEYLGYLDLLARDKRNAMTAEDRLHVLNRLIEERLVIQRALELGLPEADPKVRKTIVNAMIQTAASDADMDEPSDSEIENFYGENLSYFSSPTRISARRMVFRGEDAQQRAIDAHTALGEQSWTDVEQEFADQDLLSLPSGPLPISKLRGYLGPSKANALASMSVKTYSPPMIEQGGYTILYLLDAEQSAAPPLDEILEQVQREYLRRARDAAVRSYLENLRDQAEVTVDDDFLAGLEQAQNQ